MTKTYSIPKTPDELLNPPNSTNTTACPDDKHVFAGLFLYDGMLCNCGKVKHDRSQVWISQIGILCHKLRRAGYRITVHPDGDMQVERAQD
jgi:hypothetical protein